LWIFYFEEGGFILFIPFIVMINFFLLPLFILVHIFESSQRWDERVVLWLEGATQPIFIFPGLFILLFLIYLYLY